MSLSNGRPKSGNLTIEPYLFEGLNGQKVDAELGLFVVPENRSNPSCNLIELAFVRFRTTARNPGPTILYLAGGPGGSGIEAARGTRFPLFMAMREVGDVIALDQRGTGMSKPSLLCPEPLWSFPSNMPGNQEEMLHILKKRSRTSAQFLSDRGIDLSAYNTNESADDIESLRRALGQERISLWGISYGTHLALATIRRHEESIHKAILAGVEGPDHTLKLPSNYDKHLREIDRLIKKDSELGNQIPDLFGLMKVVLDRLEKHPVTVEAVDPHTKRQVKIAISRFDLQLLLTSNLGSTQFVRTLPSALYAMSRGDFSPVSQWMLTRRQLFESWRGYAMSCVMDCASGVSEERYARIKAEASESLLGDAVNFPFPEICEAWMTPDLGPGFREPVRSNVPVLFISGTLDANTPVSNAEEVQQRFPKGKRLIIEGAGHGDDLFLSSPKIREVMIEFMKGVHISTRRITLPRVKFKQLS